MEDGRKVSFWDLYCYVYHNPELKALVDSRRADIPLVEGERVGGGGYIPATLSRRRLSTAAVPPTSL